VIYVNKVESRKVEPQEKGKNFRDIEFRVIRSNFPVISKADETGVGSRLTARRLSKRGANYRDSTVPDLPDFP